MLDLVRQTATYNTTILTYLPVLYTRCTFYVHLCSYYVTSPFVLLFLLSKKYFFEKLGGLCGEQVNGVTRRRVPDAQIYPLTGNQNPVWVTGGLPIVQEVFTSNQRVKALSNLIRPYDAIHQLPLRVHVICFPYGQRRSSKTTFPEMAGCLSTSNSTSLPTILRELSSFVVSSFLHSPTTLPSRSTAMRSRTAQYPTQCFLQP